MVLGHRVQIFKTIYWSLLVVLICSLPFFPAIVSMAQMALILVWLFSGDLKNQIARLKQEKNIWIFSGIYVIHCIGVINSIDLKWAVHDLTIKVPLLILPIIVGTFSALTISQLKNLFYIFAVFIFIKTLISFSLYIEYTSENILISREIAGKISHIRLSLLINIVIFGLLYFGFLHKPAPQIFEKIGIGVLILWFIYFLYILQSLTGIFIFCLITILLMIYQTIKIQNRIKKIVQLFFVLLIPSIAISYVVFSVTKFYTIDFVDFKNLEKFTPSGNKYFHDTINKTVENGYYTNIYICYKELEEEWNKRSAISFSESDKKNQPLKSTLIRYLTSKGLRKNAESVRLLTDRDIQLIENGTANYLFARANHPYVRIYKIIWQFDRYFKGYSPDGHSITLRIEYFKTALRIIKQNYLFGVGTGDIPKAFYIQYINDQSKITSPHRKRAHNQYITFIVAFGIPLGLFAIAAMFLPIISLKKRDYFSLIFIITASISMLNEDTLETQAGVTFFAFFYSLFIFGRINLKKENKPELNPNTNN